MSTWLLNGPLFDFKNRSQWWLVFLYYTNSVCYSFQKHFIAQRRSFYHADKVIEMNRTSFRPSIINLNPTKLTFFSKVHTYIFRHALDRLTKVHGRSRHPNILGDPNILKRKLALENLENSAKASVMVKK